MGLAVVGCGSMGRNHARVASELGILSGVYDSDTSSSREVAERLHVRLYSSFEEVLEDRSVDSVVVATPTSTHSQIALAVLESGKDALVEKPLAPTSKEARELVERARRRGRILAVGHVERHNPVVSYARALLEKGEMGEIISLSSRRVSNFPGRIRDVGCILDLGIHDADVLAHLSGSPIRKVFALGGSFKAEAPLEDHALLLFEHENGVSSFAEINWLTPRKVRKFWITASLAYLEGDYLDQRIVISTSSFAPVDPFNLFEIPQELQERVVLLKKEEPLRREILDFLRSVRERTPPLVPAEEGVRALLVAEAALRSLASGLPERVERL